MKRVLSANVLVCQLDNCIWGNNPCTISRMCWPKPPSIHVHHTKSVLSQILNIHLLINKNSLLTALGHDKLRCVELGIRDYVHLSAQSC